MRGLRAATSFLTRLPVGTAGAQEVSSGVPWFPIVGAAVGLATGAVYAGASHVLPQFPAATLAVAFGVWATGAFHEDGLADTADAFGMRRPPEESLRILRDPRIGAFGVSALALALLARVGLLASLEEGEALLVLPAAHAVSRAGAVGLLLAPSGRADGLGATYTSSTSHTHVFVAVVVGLAIGLATLGPLVAAGLAGVLISCAVLARLSGRRIGGVTGDVMGAAQQLGEIAVLTVVVAARRLGWVDLPWWS